MREAASLWDRGSTQEGRRACLLGGCSGFSSPEGGPETRTHRDKDLWKVLFYKERTGKQDREGEGARRGSELRPKSAKA